MGLEKLIADIKRKNVIPVIGQGLCRIESESEKKSDILLYDYLAEQVMEKWGWGATLRPDLNHKFAKSCFKYLKNNPDGYSQLSEFLKGKLKDIYLKPSIPLWKLARIKNFDIFINTAYDSMLENALKAVRRTSIATLSYTKQEKYLNKLDNELFNDIEKAACTLVYHIFGNFENAKPAYTENDLLENMMEFNGDMLENPQNNLFQKIGSRSLLFIQCGFDDWLLRFFIRIMTGKSYDSFTKDQTFKIFVADNFKNNLKDPQQELFHFLSDYGIEVFHTNDGSDFIDMLYDKIGTDNPELLINPAAVISFEKSDRAAAEILGQNLRNDGIDVWWEGSNLEEHGASKGILIKSIDNSPAYIPLISKHSEQSMSNNGELKHHKKDWERAYKQMASRKTDIIPVTIDDTTWKFDRFDDLNHLKIRGGARKGDYDKLKDMLSDIQRKTQD
jgi:hypothetical protein